MSDSESIDEAAHVAHGAGNPVALGHEPDRTSLRPILIGAAVLATLVALGFVVPTLLETVFVAREERLGPPPNPLVASAGRQLPSGPRLQVNPWRDITAFRAAERELLTTYGWIDRQRGVVRIPIDRAMDIVAERSAKGAAR